MKELSYFRETRKDSTLLYDGKVLHVYKGYHQPAERKDRDARILPPRRCRRGRTADTRGQGGLRPAVPLRTGTRHAGDSRRKAGSPGADHTEAALRELHEETGYRTPALTPIGELATSPPY